MSIKPVLPLTTENHSSSHPSHSLCKTPQTSKPNNQPYTCAGRKYHTHTHHPTMPSRQGSFSYGDYPELEAVADWTYGRRPSRSHRPSVSHGGYHEASGTHYDPYNSYTPVYRSHSHSHSHARSRSPQRSTSTRRPSYTPDQNTYRRRSSTSHATSEDHERYPLGRRTAADRFLHPFNKKEYNKVYNARPEVREHAREYQKAYRVRSEVYERSKAAQREKTAARRRAEEEELERTGRLSKWHLPGSR